MAIFIIVVLVILVFVLLYLYGGQTINKNTPPLSLKYPDLTNLILSSHSNNQILVDHGNKLVIGISNTAGSTLFSISETPNNFLRIVYSIKNNPIIADFELRFEFTQISCLHDPTSVLSRLNLLIGQEIQNKLSSN